MSKPDPFSYCDQKFGKDIAVFHELAEHKFVDISGEQLPASAKLVAKLPFGMHPHVLHVFNVDLFGCPPVRNNVSPWQNNM